MVKGKNKIIIIVLSALVAITFLVGIVTAFVYNYNQFSPKTVKILDDGKNIYISTTLNDNYSKYRFKFVDEEKNEIVVDSENNVLNLPQLLEKGIKVGKTYKVSTCYLSQNEGNNSSFSEQIEWEVYSYLKPVVLNYDEVDTISWDKVDNADFYRVFYNTKNNTSYIETTETSIDLQKIEGGQRSFYCVAYSNDEHYKTSQKSNVKDIKVIYRLKDFVEVSYNSGTSIVSVVGVDKLDKFLIYIGETSYEVIDFEVSYNEELKQYTYTKDISSIYNGGKIGAAPIDIDEYNKFLGSITYVK